MKKSTLLYSLVWALLFLSACSPKAFISKSASNKIFSDSTISKAHIGISIYDPLKQKYLYNYQGDKYFVPASNTKIYSCYAAMKFLGDSLPGMYYSENDTAIYLIPTGDPSLLHSDYKNQPVIRFMQQAKKKLYITDQIWKDDALGPGWSWADYNSSYSAERSPLPLYGNCIKWVQEKTEDTASGDNPFDQSVFVYSIPEVNWKVNFNADITTRRFSVLRDKNENIFNITQGKETEKREQEIPFVTDGLQSALVLLKDTVRQDVHINNNLPANLPKPVVIHSQPVDSLLKPMMHRSDNFFAEQVLFMVGSTRFNELDQYKVIDTLLKNELSDLPQKPRWADGSGLSRYNLFTPQDMIAVLQKIKNEFGMDRIKNVFPTGGTGTLSGLYLQDSGYIFAKTGTLSGVVAISGFLFTSSNKPLVFSILVNNHRGNAADIRKAIEGFLQEIRRKF